MKEIKIRMNSGTYARLSSLAKQDFRTIDQEFAALVELEYMRRQPEDSLTMTKFYPAKLLQQGKAEEGEQGNQKIASKNVVDNSPRGEPTEDWSVEQWYKSFYDYIKMLEVDGLAGRVGNAIITAIRLYHEEGVKHSYMFKNMQEKPYPHPHNIIDEICMELLMVDNLGRKGRRELSLAHKRHKERNHDNN